MRLGHFHFHGAIVGRSAPSVARGSAVASAAYQANEALVHEQQRVGELALSHRKRLNKGIITDELRQELRLHDVTLSDDAIATKDGRRDWSITDGDATYQIKEFEERTTNKKTGKREVTKRALDLFKDTEYDYTDKYDKVESWVQVPESATDWMTQIADKGATLDSSDRAAIWNHAERAEIARDRQVARKISMSLPRDLPYEKSRELVKAFVEEHFTRHGIVCDVSIHKIERASDGQPNVHAHLLTTMRPLDESGDFAKLKHNKNEKSAYWSNRQRYIEWRKAWADLQNDAFREAGINVRVSHLSYKRLGIDKKAGIHLGPSAKHMEDRGTRTQRGDQNRAISDKNEQESQWDYQISADPIRMGEEPTTFMPQRRRARDPRSDRQPVGHSSHAYGHTSEPLITQGQPNLGNMHIDPAKLKNVDNLAQIATLAIQNGKVKTLPRQPHVIKQQVVAKKNLSRPLKSHRHQPEQNQAGWVSRAARAARNFTKQAMQSTRHAVRKVVGRWTGREQGRAPHQKTERDIER